MDALATLVDRALSVPTAAELGSCIGHGYVDAIGAECIRCSWAGLASAEYRVAYLRSAKTYELQLMVRGSWQPIGSGSAEDCAIRLRSHWIAYATRVLGGQAVGEVAA